MSRQISFREAVIEAMAQEMRRDENVILIGEDVGPSGGIFKCSEGLFNEFGGSRVIDAPISEAGYMGVSVGAAMTGLRPIAELMFGDFSLLTMDQLVNQAAKIRYMTGGQCKVSLTVRLTMGAGRSSAAQHSQSLHALFAHIPGLKVALPSCPHDAKGLLKAAIRDENPVFFCEHKMLYKRKGPVPDGEHIVPFGVAAVKREGTDITLIGVGYQVQICLEAAELLAAEGISAEVVDPRTVAPLDTATLAESVRKTNRCVVVEEGHLRSGVGAEISAVLQEEAFDYLDAPVGRVAALNAPIPFEPALEDYVLPNAGNVVEAAKKALGVIA